MKRRTTILNSIVINQSNPPNLKEFQKITKFEKPRELSWFSFDSERNLQVEKRSSLSVLQSQKSISLPLDMNQGFPEDYIERKNTFEALDALLLTLKSKTRHQAEFITWRGIITKIITTPYSLRDNWSILAVKRGETIYLFEDEAEGKGKNGFGDTEEQKKFVYYGYKAETLLTGGHVVNTNVQFVSVFETKLGNHRLVLGGEVDCIEHEVTDNDYQNRYVEIKTHRLITDERQNTSFIKFKCLKTWAQSFLAGVSKVLFAFRDDRGFIQKLQMYETAQFPRLARQAGLWDPNVCLTFGSRVLDIAKREVKEEGMVYRIAFDSSLREVSIEEPFKDESISQRIYNFL